MMTDIWVVTSEGWNGRRNARCVLAGDEDQARHAHLEHYPDEQIVMVRPAADLGLMTQTCISAAGAIQGQVARNPHRNNR